jgi:hypothetical protein
LDVPDGVATRRQRWIDAALQARSIGADSAVMGHEPPVPRRSMICIVDPALERGSRTGTYWIARACARAAEPP